MANCEISGKPVRRSPIEQELREKLSAPEPRTLSRYTLQHLSAFWQHFAIHRRRCDLSGERIVSVFSEHCPYPVWKRELWLQEAQPPQADYDPEQGFFEQLWELFRQCPMPHNVGAGNENCEYTDDWWYSKNCYLSHSGLECEDSQYLYRTVRLVNCQYCVFSFDCELCADCVDCNQCYNVNYAVGSRQCRDSAFLLDCRDCADCLFCWNLRNKQYCYENCQLSKAEFEEKRRALRLSSAREYQVAENRFRRLVDDHAYWRASKVENCVNSNGNYLAECKNSQNCFFAAHAQDCANFLRGYRVKDLLDSVGNLDAELCYLTSCAQDHSYDIQYCFNVTKSRYLRHSANCHNCEYCFACCGLVNGRYCILNKEYPPDEYWRLVKVLEQAIRDQDLEGRFFPKYFSPTCYHESLAAVHFPLSFKAAKEQGFRVEGFEEARASEALDLSELPDDSSDATADLVGKAFWDNVEGRPFRIHKFDIEFAQKLSRPLPRYYYVRRLQELFLWMPFPGFQRKTRCAKSGRLIQTTLPEERDARILSEESYLEMIR